MDKLFYAVVVFGVLIWFAVADGVRRIEKLLTEIQLGLETKRRH